VRNTALEKDKKERKVTKDEHPAYNSDSKAVPPIP
jgi:hypothetical protein